MNAVTVHALLISVPRSRLYVKKKKVKEKSLFKLKTFDITVSAYIS